jgi:cyclophilin family peptidyl-prolyl cis-trans isomerase
MLRSSLALGLLVTLLIPAPFIAAEQAKPAPNPILVLDTAKGIIEIEVFPSESPKSVGQVLTLAGRNFYRNQRVHWVQPGVIQFGDPSTRDMTKQYNWGLGGSGRPVNVFEPSKRPFVRGSVGLAYRKDEKPTTADSQIFILRLANPAMNGKYAMLGRVTKGLDIVDKIAQNDVVKNLTLKPAKP